MAPLWLRRDQSANRQVALAPESDRPAKLASSPAGRARPSASAPSIAARAGLPISAATDATSGSPRIVPTYLKHWVRLNHYFCQYAKGGKMTENTVQARNFLADCEFIFREWDTRAKALDSEGLLQLYATDAILESPLIPAILDDKRDGILRGHQELRRFFKEGGKRRPNALIRWHRTGQWLTDGHRFLVWEYPREAPDGDQVDLVEVMEIENGLIQYHRVYWGWKGCALIAPALVQNAAKPTA
jgi:hypothetical protein